MAQITYLYSNKPLLPLYDAEDAETIAICLAPSTTFTKGMVLGEITASPGVYKPYASGNSDGSQNAKLFLKYDCITDAQGNITFTSTAGQVGNDIGVTSKTAPAYFEGVFATSELVQAGPGAIDAAAVSQMGAALIQGTLANGVLRLS